MTKTIKAVIAAGGTGGHIIPALAIADELRKRYVTILYVGNSNSMEEKLVQKTGIDFATIDVQKLYRNFTWKHCLFPYKLIVSVLSSLRIMNKFKPDVFIGVGGFVSGPVGFAAKLAHIPIFLQEQNSYPGITTKALAKYATAVFLGYAGAEKYFKKTKTLVSGNPVNSNVLYEKDKILFDSYGLSEKSKKIFLLGGSQGSVALNEAFRPIVQRLLDSGFEIIWQTGVKQYSEIQNQFSEKKGLYIFGFTTEMGKLYNSIDLIISRAGAITLAEIERKKVPSLLIPLPNAAENHQYFNALELEKKGIARILMQSKLTSEILLETILNMLADNSSYKANFKKHYADNPAKYIAEYILDTIKR
jgi:UDP-N-acetylglucosamine--N-acetylmuramyl-(pentapeptide) pyrophosphoryl-undecaprenol N-acetylglucosamine transferase